MKKAPQFLPPPQQGNGTNNFFPPPQQVNGTNNFFPSPQQVNGTNNFFLPLPQQVNGTNNFFPPPQQPLLSQQINFTQQVNAIGKTNKMELLLPKNNSGKNGGASIRDCKHTFFPPDNFKFLFKENPKIYINKVLNTVFCVREENDKRVVVPDLEKKKRYTMHFVDFTRKKEGEGYEMNVTPPLTNQATPK
jgi:hypothetical protein